jgi:16S rRNA processing protein RimM
VDEDAQHSFIAIARIARTRGNRGEVLADLYTDFPNRFNSLDEVWLEFPDGRKQCLAVEDTWVHKGRRVLKFEGIDTIGEAETLAGCWVVVPADQAVQLPEGTYFDHDLTGCRVEDLEGNLLGTVSGILRISGNNQLIVKDLSREFLVPVVEAICAEIDIAQKRIIIDAPEGLMDLD